MFWLIRVRSDSGITPRCNGWFQPRVTTSRQPFGVLGSLWLHLAVLRLPLRSTTETLAGPASSAASIAAGGSTQPSALRPVDEGANRTATRPTCRVPGLLRLTQAGQLLDQRLDVWAVVMRGVQQCGWAVRSLIQAVCQLMLHQAGQPQPARRCR